MSGPLITAIVDGDLETVQVLLGGGTDPNTDCAPGIAAEENQPDILNVLLDAGGALEGCDAEQWTPLQEAACAGHVGIVRLLLARGADPTHTSEEDEAPLLLAIRKGHREIVDLLGGIPASLRPLNIRDRVVLEDVEQVKAWLAAGGDPSGEDLLFYAADRGRTEVVACLIAAGARDTGSEGGPLTALMMAASRGHRETVAVLLSSDVCVLEATSEDGDTAWDLALEHGHDEIVALLEEAG